MEKVLVIEDMKSVQLLLRKQLEKLGYDVVVASNGKEGITEFCAHEDIKLILLDIMMPVMDGVEFLEKYSKICEERGVKICMLTALAEEEDIIKCLNLGAYDYMTKPIDLELLDDKLDYLVKQNTSKKFATIKANFKIEVYKEEGITYEGKMHFLSENRCMVSSEKEFSGGDRVSFKSSELMSHLNDNFDLTGRIILAKKEQDEFYYYIDFVGMVEGKVRKIRTLTVLGKDIGVAESDKNK